MQISKIKNTRKTLEAIVYPLLLLLIMWSIYLIDYSYHLNFYKLGVKPGTTEGIKGILFMPLIHSQDNFHHILNNSAPIIILLGTLIYFYHEIALKVFIFIWIAGGFLLWYFANNPYTYHIGMSGVIYGLFGFLFLSGFLKKYMPLQAISLFVAFLYGSLFWGIFPTEERISWEGHLSGLLIGMLLAFAFRKHGPVSPKYRYEIEQELGISPPNYENNWEQNQETSQVDESLNEHNSVQPDIDNQKENRASNTSNFPSIEYHYIPQKKSNSQDKKV